MQISRHWRMNAQRYRLQGVRYENGEVSMQSRPIARDNDEVRQQVARELTPETHKPQVAAR